MEEKTISAPAEELKTPLETEVKTPEENNNNGEETTGAALGTETVQEKSVPLSTYLAMKRENKELTRQMKELQKSIEAGSSEREVSADLREIAQRHDVDESFLEDFANAVRAKTKKEVEDEVLSAIQPIQEAENAKKIDEAFNVHFEKAMEAMPEYKDIVNKDVIKSLSLDPRNAHTTFTKIIEEAYGHLATGKKTLETSTPGGSKDEITEIDYSKINNPDYFKEVMSNPVLRKKYNENLQNRIGL